MTSPADATSAARQEKRAAQLAARIGQQNLMLALEKKKRCAARAQLLVEEFIETVGDTVRFLDQLQYIAQSHYEDIVEERSIVHLCGYPMCSSPLQNVPNKKFHISRASNTIYDITERKKFCSTGCFRASNYIHAQLLTSPLWIRDAEPIPRFQLLAEWRNPAQPQPAPMDVATTEVTKTAKETERLAADLEERPLHEALHSLSIDGK